VYTFFQKVGNASFYVFAQKMNAKLRSLKVALPQLVFAADISFWNLSFLLKTGQKMMSLFPICRLMISKIRGVNGHID
jgi:hypothetical protein